MKNVPIRQSPIPARTAKSRRTPHASRSIAPADSSPVEDIRDAVTRLKRERIIATAVDLFHNNGLGNTTLEAVAEKMNVTKPFIYSHFKSKGDLLAEICAHGIRASLEVVNRVAASEGSATEKMAAMTRDFMLAVLENQGHIAIYTREQKHLARADSDAIDDMRREFDRKVCALLEEGVTSGEFIVDDVQMASLSIGGIVSWSYVWYRPNGRLTRLETAERIADLVMAMVQAKPARRSGKPGNGAKMLPKLIKTK